MLNQINLSQLRTMLENEFSLVLEDDELYHAAIAIARFVCGKELRLAEINTINAKGGNHGKKTR